VLAKWTGRWAARADEAALGLGTVLEAAAGIPAAEVAAHARTAREQFRAGLVPLGCVDDFRVDWQWIPAWRPADITDSGREQLRAIGFTI
jgi:hypothetical protein